MSLSERERIKKVKLVQELSENDFGQIFEFCKICMTMCDQPPNFLANVVFSDKATFNLNGQHGLSKEKSLTTSHFVSTYNYNNSDMRCLNKIRQPVSLYHCSAEITCSRTGDITKTPIRNYSILNAILPSRPLAQVPVKLFTQKAILESIVYDGIGWAGQPIVKRIHPILPEVYGDMTNSFKIVENQQPSSSNSPLAMSANIEPTTNSYTRLTIGSVGENLNEKVLKSGGLEDLKNLGQISNEALSTTLEKGQEFLTNNIVKIQKAFMSKNISSIPNKILPSKIKNEHTMLKNEDFVSKQEVAYKKTKLKKRKKTKMCDSKSNVKFHIGSSKSINDKKGKPKAFIIERKHTMGSYIVNQKTNTHNLTNNKVLRMENRQFNTGDALYYPRASVKVTEKSSIQKDIKYISKKNKSNSENNTFNDDCTCPELLAAKSKRRKTKICGNAAAIEEKKETKKWKPKMCLFEAPVKYRNRTFVCASKVYELGKKKQQLPKCVKPEKKIAPRVQICPPNLFNELEMKSKKCEKPIEAEKIRKRTKVCKPVLLFAKELIEVKMEKSACTNVKKTISRHTKICPPENENKSKKIQLRN